MTITAATLWEQKVRQFKRESSASRFASNYIDAINFALKAIDSGTNASSDTTLISDVETAIDLDADLEWVLSVCADYWLIRFGHKSGDLDLRTAKADMEDALAWARVHRDQDATAAATNGETFGDIDTVSTS